MKGPLRNSLFVAVLGWLIWAYMALCARTIRWRVEGEEAARAVWAGEGGVIVAAWHNAILLLPTGWIRQMRHWPGRRGPAAMMISLSADGEAVARAIRHLGLEAIRGSAQNPKKARDKGGQAAIVRASSLLKSGGAVCVTPDGPRGPARKVGKGPALLAQRAGAVILPYGLACRPGKSLKTWDRFRIPFPFTRGAIVYGAPLSAPRDMPVEALVAQLQSALDAASERAEALCGS